MNFTLVSLFTVVVDVVHTSTVFLVKKTMRKSMGTPLARPHIRWSLSRDPSFWLLVFLVMRPMHPISILNPFFGS
jgi:hypothetical protein